MPADEDDSARRCREIRPEHPGVAVLDSSAMQPRYTWTLTALAQTTPNDHHPRNRFHPEHRRRAPVHLLLSPAATMIQSLAAAYEREEIPGGARRHGPDPGQFADVRRGSSARSARIPALSIVFLKIGMEVRWESTHERAGHGRRGRAPRLSGSGQPAARLHGRADRSVRARTPATIRRRWSTLELVPGDQVEVTSRRQGRRLGEQVEVRHPQPERQPGGLGAEDGPDHGGGLVPARHARHRRRRLRGKGDAAGEGVTARTRSTSTNSRRAVRPTRIEELRLELFEKVNALGIGAQGLGGLTTVLDVKILTYPTHAASLPVAMIPNCAATRHRGIHPGRLRPRGLDAAESGRLARPSPGRLAPARAGWIWIGVTREEIATWQPGERLLLSGKLLTGRDAAHQAHRRPAGPGRVSTSGRGSREPLHLLRRTGRPGARRGRRPRRPHHRHPHGQIHRADARRDRSDRHDRQGRARSSGHRGDQTPRRRLSDGGRRRGLSGRQGDQELAD